MVLAIEERACLFIDQLDRFNRFVYILSDALCQNLVFSRHLEYLEIKTGNQDSTYQNVEMTRER